MKNFRMILKKGILFFSFFLICNISNSQNKGFEIHSRSSEFTIDDISVEDVSPYILGSEIVCNTNSTFYLYNCPQNCSVIWSHSNNLVEVLQPPHNNDPLKYIVKASSNYTSDYGWVKAKIIPNSIPVPITTPPDDKNEITLYAMKTFWIGIPPYFFLNGTNELYTGDPGISLIQHGNNWDYLVNSVTWTYNGAHLNYLNGNTERADFRAGNEIGVGYIYAKAENQCGQRENNMFYRIIESWNKSYPNPANDILNIEIENNNLPENLENKTFEIRLYDNLMNLKKIEKNVSFITQINVSDLEEGIYILQIISENNIIEEKIIITH